MMDSEMLVLWLTDLRVFTKATTEQDAMLCELWAGATNNRLINRRKA